MTLFGAALALLVSGGILALVFARWPAVSSACAVGGAVLGGAIGEVAAVRGLFGETSSFSLAWEIPYGRIHAAIDPLSAFFLVPVFGIGLLAAIYGRAYLADHPRQRSLVWFAFDALLASMACVVVARQAVFFLVAWELMSLAAYLLVTFEHEHAEVRRAGWVYLIATHVGMACLVALFVLLRRRAGSFDFDTMMAVGDPPVALGIVLFALGFVGFGIKAGIVPFHVWLPEAHAAAPSHVSALMSAVLVKMGVYGLLRTLLLLGHPAPWWGAVFAIFGLAGGLLGISLALYQRDMKRVLAYSSIENIGIVALGVGTALWGSTSGRPAVAAIAMTGALLHVWNHSLVKSLLFLGAGSVLHGCGTKDLERLGGVAKRMPITGACIALGAIAISALPPLNAFASEWLVYLGLGRAALDGGGAMGVATALSIGGLSFIGALTVLCFVRFVGIGILGEPRSEGAARAHESSASMTSILVVLGLLCGGAAVTPHVLVRAIAPVASQLLGAGVQAESSLPVIASIHAGLWILLAVGLLVARALRNSGNPDSTWGCGYAAPTTRMQYTGRSFAEIMAERLLPGALRPRVSIDAPSGLFPRSASLRSDSADPVTRGVYEPFLSRWGDRFARLRWLQQGVLHAYLLYIVVAAVVLLGWISLRSWSGR